MQMVTPVPSGCVRKDGEDLLIKPKLTMISQDLTPIYMYFDLQYSQITWQGLKQDSTVEADGSAPFHKEGAGSL